MKLLSQKSVARYRALIGKLAVMQSKATGPQVVALVDRHDPHRLVICNLDDGTLRPLLGEADIIIAERFRGGLTVDLDIAILKDSLAHGGAILVRRSGLLARLIGSIIARRTDDRASSIYRRGADRREAAIRRASLYLSLLKLVQGPGRIEEWIVASTAPIDDRRVRDSIGRVATDYLRSAGPVIVGTGLHLPGL